MLASYQKRFSWAVSLMEPLFTRIRYRNSLPQWKITSECRLSVAKSTADHRGNFGRTVSIGGISSGGFLRPHPSRTSVGTGKKKQREVAKWNAIITSIESGRSVGRQYCLLENRLFKHKTIYGRSYIRLCVPPEFRELILKSCHDDPVSGHSTNFGQNCRSFRLGFNGNRRNPLR